MAYTNRMFYLCFLFPSEERGGGGVELKAGRFRRSSSLKRCFWEVGTKEQQEKEIVCRILGPHDGDYLLDCDTVESGSS
jgi:hypothetical protein